ncbi:hypothetical protein [Phenylobacterium deserti]|uniref:Uncharacterized protein n=1 Tax=Phenylobacterium deserti TaxID=1914756 RepID=A0A328ARM0_9CAUL|nr:hypothetical protein [Phenylobacterium deserti]RAK56955.1 hypothetical protein DJ018_03020 [Phenylobacterium deserti]
MTDVAPNTPSTDTTAELQIAEVDFKAGPVSLQARVRVTPAGLLAIGGLVSSILLSSAVIVWTATSVARRHPITTLRR